MSAWSWDENLVPYYPRGAHNVGFPADADWAVLSPGTYRLYLVSDGTEASVTVLFDGLPGAVALTTDRLTALDYRELEPELTTAMIEGMPRSVQNFSVAHDVDDYALTFFGLHVG